jgi:hypothetical protein
MNQGQFAVKAAMSFVVLLACLYMILSKQYGPKETHWAYGVVCTLLGFWLKS